VRREHVQAAPSAHQPAAEVERQFDQHPAARIYRSQPGVASKLGPWLLGESGDDPRRYASAKARTNYAGTTPITRQSGSKRTVSSRFVHNERVLDALGPANRLARETITKRPPPGDQPQAGQAVRYTLAAQLGCWSSALVAQGIEHRFPKPCVAGSIPAGGTSGSGSEQPERHVDPTR
jgi:hypothetical protein